MTVYTEFVQYVGALVYLLLETRQAMFTTGYDALYETLRVACFFVGVRGLASRYAVNHPFEMFEHLQQDWQLAKK